MSPNLHKITINVTGMASHLNIPDKYLQSARSKITDSMQSRATIGPATLHYSAANVRNYRFKKTILGMSWECYSWHQIKSRLAWNVIFHRQEVKHFIWSLLWPEVLISLFLYKCGRRYLQFEQYNGMSPLNSKLHWVKSKFSCYYNDTIYNNSNRFIRIW